MGEGVSEGVSVGLLLAACRVLRETHGERVLGSRGEFNEFVRALGGAERAWLALPRPPSPAGGKGAEGG